MKKLTAMLFAFLLIFNSNVHASTGSVGSPGVTKGKTAINVRASFTDDETGSSNENRLRTRFHIDHGFTDYYAFRVVVAQDKRDAGNYEHASITFENRFELLNRKKHGFDLGARLNYQLADNDDGPDSVSVQFFERGYINKWELRSRQSFDHDVGGGSESGVDAELRLQATHPISKTHRLGLESFHDFGNVTELSGYEDQDHTIGPVLKGKLAKGYSYETGYRAGISNAAPNHIVKLFINKSF